MSPFYKNYKQRLMRDKNAETEINRDGSFRDRISTNTEEGKRAWIHPKKPKGRFYNRRRVVAAVLLSLMFVFPWIRFKGEPFILFNIFERKFILFGQLFWPQDFHLVVVGIISIIVFVILFTVIFGRLFCGWACPQTLFMEFLFRQVEYLIDGDFNKQKKLRQQPWNFDKIWRRTLKTVIFLLIAFALSFTFFSYIVGTDTMLAVITGTPSEHYAGLAALLFFTGIIYFIYSYFREQVCLIVCPYGRLQGVLLDNKSVVVAYDYKRGEPRGKQKAKDDTAPRGDCIDCNSCVVVCPTGIDIRNGTQLECINCTACIDACDAIMDRAGKPRGLIRYSSEKFIAEGKGTIFNARAMAYSGFLVLLLVLLSSLFMMRTEVEATILRVPGTMFQEYGPDSYSNIYKIQLVNKTRKDMPVELKLESGEGEVIVMGDPIVVEGSKVMEANFLLVKPATSIKSSNTPVVVGVYCEGEQIEKFPTTFIAPNSFDK